MSSWPFLGDQLKQNSKFKSEHILHASARYILVSTCLSQSSDPIFSTPGPTEWTCLNPSPSRSSFDTLRSAAAISQNELSCSRFTCPFDSSWCLFPSQDPWNGHGESRVARNPSLSGKNSPLYRAYQLWFSIALSDPSVVLFCLLFFFQDQWYEFEWVLQVCQLRIDTNHFRNKFQVCCHDMNIKLSCSLSISCSNHLF